jgi:uncharacterized membrane protein YraQ (UPF0718 family)
VTVVLVAAYFILIHIIEGYVLGPRILGRSLGLHPAISIVALLIGGEVFGLWGALFAAPIAGIIQVVLSTFWRELRESHPQMFPELAEEAAGADEATITGVAAITDVAAEQQAATPAAPIFMAPGGGS